MEQWGERVSIKGYFIQYKFILPEGIRHSSYTYQKLFRALYGYTQIVNKSSGKNYKYHRAGVLSNIPYIRSGKNCVVIPSESFQTLINFFKTGSNPTHHWRTKGDWKAVYYMDEKQINTNLIVQALEQLVDRQYLENKKRLFDEMQRVTSSEQVNLDYATLVCSQAEAIAKHNWFKTTYSNSKKLKEFKTLFDSLTKMKK